MICFAAFTPHSPLLIESIGKENTKRLAKTRSAMDILSGRLLAAEPDVLFVISSHSVTHEKAFSINLHDEYHIDFKEFGDHASSGDFFPDLELVTAIQRSARTAQIPFVLESYSALDYGSGVPLHLVKPSSKTKIVPISYSGYDRKQHMAFGRLLKDVALNTNRRVAIVASGDLSHCLSSDAPMGFKKEGKDFDDAVQQSIEQFSSSKLLTIAQEQVDAAQQCALRPLLIFFGVLERLRIRPEVLSYESPFGVGYLVAELHIL